MFRSYNFGAGPATLPLAILEKAKSELLDWQSLGMSVMEVSHRSSYIKAMVEKAKGCLIDLLKIPDSYEVLFLTTPARSQFSSVPLNLLNQDLKADYVSTGLWSRLAIKEAKKYARVNTVYELQTPSEPIADVSHWQMDKSASYCHYTPNETIDGIQIKTPPVVSVPLVADMTSELLTKPINIRDYALLYAGAQKNCGIAGLTIVILQKALLGHALSFTPSVFDYQIQAENQSLYYTPASFSYYMAMLMFDWIKEQGGVEEIAKINLEKAALLYDFIDNSDFYENRVHDSIRSTVNIPFHIVGKELTDEFIKDAKEHNLCALKGHRLVGGLRASLYNPMPIEGVKALVSFMKTFENSHT